MDTIESIHSHIHVYAYTRACMHICMRTSYMLSLLILTRSNAPNLQSNATNFYLSLTPSHDEREEGS
jgi:hypothetical protein